MGRRVREGLTYNVHDGLVFLFSYLILNNYLRVRHVNNSAGGAMFEEEEHEDWDEDPDEFDDWDLENN